MKNNLQEKSGHTALNQSYQFILMAFLMYLRVLSSLKIIIVRALGSIALDMCFVADGTLDGLIDTRGLVSGYDIMASALILKESGGTLTDLKGKNLADNVQVTGLSIAGQKTANFMKRS